MRKKCLAGIMVLCLLLSMMPTMAFATEAECTKTEGCTAVAHEEGCPAADPASGGDGNDPTVLLDEPADGYTEWTSTDSLPTSGTYRLADNVTIKPTFFEYATVTRSLVLDLAGHTVTVSDEGDGNYAYFVNSSNASLVIEDSVGGGKITNAGTTDRMLTLIQVNNGSFELKGGTLENTSSMGYAVFINSSAQLTMTDGEIKNTVNGGYAVYINGTAGFTMEGLSLIHI